VEQRRLLQTHALHLRLPLTLPAVGVEGLISTGKKRKKSKGKGDASGLEYGLQGRMNARLITLDEQHR
jgi:hypothetical protein